MHLPVEKHKIIAKKFQLNYTIINDALKVTPYLQQYKQNLLNFRRHFLFGVSSKISSFWHYFTDEGLNILFKLVCRLRNVSKFWMYRHNSKWYITLVSFERVLRNMQKISS